MLVEILRPGHMVTPAPNGRYADVLANFLLDSTRRKRWWSEILASNAPAVVNTLSWNHYDAIFLEKIMIRKLYVELTFLDVDDSTIVAQCFVEHRY